MPIDASIYGNIGRGVKSMGEYDAEFAQAENAKQAGKMNALNLLMGERKLQADDRALADQNALRQVVGGFGADDAANVQSLFKAGRLNEARDYQKSMVDAAEKRAETGYKVAQTTKLTDEQKKAKRTEAIQHIGSMNDPMQALQSLSGSKDVPEEARAPLLAQLQAIKTPQEFREWQLRTILTLASPEQQAKAMMPKVEQQNLGATMRTVAIDPITGKPSVADEAAIAESANNVANNKRIAAEGAANRAVQIRGQDKVDARAASKKAVDDGKPLPTAALKMQQEALDAIGVASTIQSDLASLEKQIGDGKLKFGPVSNLINKGRNLAGMSNDESRNLSTFKSSLERLRNESLRLNTGVQTDGDAQRAWNELFENINDTDLVKQRLGEIQRINKRGADLQRLKVDSVRANYGKAPLETQNYTNQPAAVGSGADLGGGFTLKK
jgi:hypothetical protein